MADNLNSKIIGATKWSAAAEVAAKLISPITSMVLARLLTPEAFGVVATLTMIISFAEIFTDAGFQRYIIQHEFVDDDDKFKSTTVAFWTNLVMSFLIWGIISIFCEPLATLVGNPGLGYVISIACVSIPIAAFSSVQMALYKRSFDFKTLFYVRIVGILIPLVITIPLAFILRNFWALVIGTIATNLSNAVILTWKSKWRPNLYYSFQRLKEMLSFCIWTIIDAVLVWATGYIDIFFIGIMLSDYYLGLYKTSMATVGQITSIITAVILPVMMPALSRVQNDYAEMREMLLKFQKYTSIILLPLGVGILLFRNLVTQILLGSQWMEAAPFIGLWGLMEVIVVVFCRFCSMVYPSIGKPKVSVLSQVLHLAFLVPAVYIAVQYGFTALYWTRSLVRIQLIIVHFIIIYVLIRQSPWRMIKNIVPEALSCAVMALVGLALLRFNSSILCSFVWVAVCTVVYFAALYMFPKDRQLMMELKNQLANKIKRKKSNG